MVERLFKRIDNSPYGRLSAENKKKHDRFVSFHADHFADQDLEPLRGFESLIDEYDDLYDFFIDNGLKLPTKKTRLFERS